MAAKNSPHCWLQHKPMTCDSFSRVRMRFWPYHIIQNHTIVFPKQKFSLFPTHRNNPRVSLNLLSWGRDGRTKPQCFSRSLLFSISSTAENSPGHQLQGQKVAGSEWQTSSVSCLFPKYQKITRTQMLLTKICGLGFSCCCPTKEKSVQILSGLWQ